MAVTEGEVSGEVGEAIGGEGVGRRWCGCEGGRESSDIQRSMNCKREMYISSRYSGERVPGTLPKWQVSGKEGLSIGGDGVERRYERRREVTTPMCGANSREYSDAIKQHTWYSGERVPGTLPKWPVSGKEGLPIGGDGVERRYPRRIGV